MEDMKRFTQKNFTFIKTFIFIEKKKKGKPKFPTKMFSGDWLSKGYYTLWQDVYTVVKI